MKIIAICGMPGSGKGEIAAIAIDRGIRVHSMGDVVRDHFSRNCPERDPIETGIYADMERKKYGKDIWARRLIDTLENALTPDAEIVMIDGIRSNMEEHLFRGRWQDHFSIVAVHSSPRTRFGRLMDRGRGDDPSDRKKFDERDDRELGWGIGDVISKADLMMVNESDIEAFRERVGAMLDGLVDLP